MKRGLQYIIGATVLGVGLTITPYFIQDSYAGDKTKKRIIRNKISGAYKKIEKWIEKGQRKPTQKERMRGAGIAGKILENATGIPGIERGAKTIERNVTDSGYYNKQKKILEKQRKEYQKRKRKKWKR